MEEIQNTQETSAEEVVISPEEDAALTHEKRVEEAEQADQPTEELPEEEEVL